MDNLLLVIGYGNTLRRDDGVGPRVAAEIEEMALAGTLTLACPLLTPELAFPLSQSRAAVFVDAAVEHPWRLGLRRIDPSPLPQALAHAADPRVLLALARDAFGHAPMAWMLTVPAEDLGIGEDLSPMAERGVMDAAQAVRRLHAILRDGKPGQPAGGTKFSGLVRPQVHVRT